ncbi:MAG: hypothetical protein A3G87_10350 [Omnitrophica bacterium RIFCSPLOWO2_12_FULL_50_11]|nr:MAG: hypothetical protein A3G87_10350 [Omnitrophica bacterium RIFCSPLOWO2_12_FULL_50_11]
MRSFRPFPPDRAADPLRFVAGGPQDDPTTYSWPRGPMRLRRMNRWWDEPSLSEKNSPTAHLAMIALRVGRPRDFARILAVLESGSVSRQEMAELAAKHHLSEAWARFESRFFNE